MKKEFEIKKRKDHLVGTFLMIFITLILSLSIISAADFSIYNNSNPSQLYFAVNGTTGNVTGTYTGFFGWLGSAANRITEIFASNVDISSNLKIGGNIQGPDFNIGWANLTAYPTGCAAGEAVQIIGDTLTCINISAQGSTTLDGYDSSFFMPLNTSVVGNFTFNGGWQNGGLSITNGDLYAQTVYVYNITSLNVSNLNINGSLLPSDGFSNIFSIGSSTETWKDLYLGGTLYVNGVNVTNRIDSNNLSLNNYILYTNTTMKSYVDAMDLAFNNSNNNYILDNNNSVNNYILYTNGTMKSYVDAMDLAFNNSNNNYILANNQSVNNYILYVNSTMASTLGSNYVPYTGANKNVDFGNNNFTVNSATLFVNTNLGRVGIGTSTPANKLNVLGDFNATGTIYWNGINVTGLIDSNNLSLNNYILANNQSVNNYILYTNGTMKSYVDAMDLAFNTSNNNYIFQNNQSVNNYILYTNGTMKSYVDALNTSLDSRYLLNFGDTATGNYTFDTGTFFVDSTNDRVGVGTTIPGNRFVVEGSPAYVDFRSSVSGTNAAGQYWTNTDTGKRWAFFQRSAAGSPADGLTLIHYTNTTWVNDILNLYPDGNISADLGTLFVDAVNNRVGIGTTTPANTLNVIGTANFTGNTTSNTDFCIVGGKCLSNMGVGTMSSWTLGGSSGTNQTITDGNTAYLVAGNAITTTAAATDQVTIAVTAGSIDDNEIAQFSIDASEIAMSSINTTHILDNTILAIDLAPSSVNTTHIVDGTITVADLVSAINSSYARLDAANIFGAFNQTFDTSTFFINSNDDRVGIGTTTPASTLQVGGDIELTTVGQFEKVMNGNMFVIEYPQGAYYQTTTASITGAIEITLPINYTADMMKMVVDVFDYATDESITLIISGYNYNVGGDWVNPSVQIITTQTAKDFTVRYGGNETNNKIWIGELASVWAYPQVVVREVSLGYTSDIANWQEPWNITFESTAFDTVTETLSGNLPAAGDLSCIGCLSAIELALSSVNTTHILDNTILAVDLAPSSVNTTHIVDGTILTGDLSTAQITAALIAASAVNTTHILDDTLDFADFEDTLDLDAATVINTGANLFTLNVTSTTNLDLNMHSTGDFRILDNNAVMAQFLDTGDIQLGNGNELYVDTSANSVGIGVTDPLTTLEVAGSIFTQPTSDTNNGLSIARFSETGRAEITLGNSTLTSVVGSAVGEMWRFGMTGAGSNDFSFFDGTTTPLFLNRTSHDVILAQSSGNVGIGTTTPTQELSVAGDIEGTGMVRATGWLVGTGTDLGAEIGVSSSAAYLISYNRTSSAYGPMRIGGLNTTIYYGGSTTPAIIVDTSGNINMTGAGTTYIGTGATYLSISTDGYLTDADDSVTVNDDLIVTAGTIQITPATATNESIISLPAPTGGNDPGFIIHREDSNQGRIFLIPSDDNSGNDYVAITNTSATRSIINQENVRLYTSGAAYLAGDLNVDGGEIYDAGTTSWLEVSGCSDNTYVSSVSASGTITCTADSGTGTMSSWTLGGSSGTNQTIIDGNTAYLVAGNAITTTAAATDQVTIAVTAGSIDDNEIAQFSIDASEIAMSSINTTHILDNTILAIDLAPSSVNTTHIVDGTITVADLVSAINSSYARLDAANIFGAFNQTFDTSTFFINSNDDRVGIGTSTPANKLNVLGDFNATGTIYWNGINVTGLIDSNNLSLNNYILYTNGTMKSYVDALDSAYNTSNNNYILQNNGSVNNYILYTNGTMKSYVDAVYVPYTGANKNIDLGNNNLTVNVTTFFVNTNLGRVGIGTSTPAATLEVVGDFYLNGSRTISTNGASDSISVNPGGTLYLGGGGTDAITMGRVDAVIVPTVIRGTLSVTNNTGTQGLYQASSGNVGINKTDPIFGLEVDTGFMVTGSGGSPATSGDSAGIRILGGSATANSIYSYNYSAATWLPIQIYGTNISLMPQGASSYVGIGTTTPANALNVIGTANFTGNTTSNTDFCVVGGKCLSNMGVGTMSSWTLGGSSGTNQTITDGNTAYLVAGNAITTTAAATDQVTIAVTAGSIDDNEIAQFSIDASEIAMSSINTTHILDNTILAVDLAPSSVNTTHIVDGTITVADLVSAFNSSYARLDAVNTFGAFNQTFDTSTLFVDSVSDRVGIGTTGPDAPLDILSTAGAQLRLTYTDGTEWNGFTTNSDGSLSITNTGSGLVNLVTDSGADGRLRVGGMLIGNAFDSVPSDNEIRTTSNENLLINPQGTGNLSVDSGGLFYDNVLNRVGIGTTTPQNKLNVLGDFNATTNITSGHLLIAPSGLVPAHTGAPDAKIFSPSGQYVATNTYGVVYNEGSPDYIEFWGQSAKNAQIALENAGSSDFGINGGNLSVGSSDFFVDNTNGRVGIGTTTPNYLFSVYNSTRGTSTNLDVGNSDVLPALTIQSGASNWTDTLNGFAFFYSSTDGDLDLYRKDNSGLGTVGTHLLTFDRSGGEVGIGDTSPDWLLDVGGTAGFGTEGSQLLVSTDGYLSDADDDVIINDGLDVIAGGIISDARIKIEGTGAACSGEDDNGAGIWFSDAGDCATVFTGINSPTDGSESWGIWLGNWDWIIDRNGNVTQEGNLNMTNSSIFDVWKIYMNTGGGLDPPYRVGDTVYATWAPFIVGQKEEVTGTIESNGTYVIDFTKLEKGSDLWLFNQVTNFGKNWENLQVVLTPGFDGRVWYKKDPSKKTLTIYGTSAGEVSYRLTGNSFSDRGTNIVSELNASGYPDMANRIKIW